MENILFRKNVLVVTDDPSYVILRKEPFCAWVLARNANMTYGSLCGWIKCAIHFIFAIYTMLHTFSGHMTNIAHLGESHDQYRTLWNHVMNIAHFKSHSKHCYHSSFCIHWDDTFSGFCRYIQLGWKREAAVFTSFQWLFDCKSRCPFLRLILCKWQSPSLRLILHPMVDLPTQKLYIN